MTRDHDPSKERRLFLCGLGHEDTGETSRGDLEAWGPENDEQNGGRIIIDCLMNLPLLYWASQL